MFMVICGSEETFSKVGKGEIGRSASNRAMVRMHALFCAAIPIDYGYGWCKFLYDLMICDPATSSSCRILASLYSGTVCIWNYQSQASHLFLILFTMVKSFEVTELPGYDEGTIMVKIGREIPVASMESSGKIIWAKHNEIQTVNIKTVGADFEVRLWNSFCSQVTDGERLPLAVKELGSCDLYPQNLKHNPNGRFVVVCGDGEYIIYTALAWRNRSFGSALEFVWSSDGEYAIREMLQNLYWADSGDLLVIASDTSFYILKYNVTTMFHLDRPMYLLGYLASQSRVYLIDKEFNSFPELSGVLVQLYSFCASQLEMAEECLSHAMDLSGLLLLYSALGDAEGITKLSSLAKEQGKNNVAFLCLFMLGKLEDCLQLLVESCHLLNAVVNNRGKYPPAEEYLSYVEKSNINLVEAFKSMQVIEESLPLENGDSGHEVWMHLIFPAVTEEDGVEGQEEAVEVDVDDSTDSAVLVNGNENEEQWGMSNEGNPSA
ncbi:hypothetical protein B296_00012310 [Ensete ventricosum]|uniref:Coatomer WD associated region domain-containing protein n=1 Tax=Ensete ventricosum TaxID=4639 RepID=A0A426ZRP4_ENSVE|nr:hypothetical protein B296_00012310 [Ensete ventricosum]